LSLDPARARTWHHLGIGPLWLARDAPVASPPPVELTQAEPSHPEPMHLERTQNSGDGREARIGRLQWDELRVAVADCTACSLCKTRKQTVFGVGFQSARWMLIGEAPGAEEDQRGEPFVGQAGRLLDNMLAAAGLTRTGESERSVYIANVLKCRPPGNRNPEPAEVALCEPFLLRQVQLVQPRVVVVMGRFAAQSLLRTDATIASLRGRVHHIDVAGSRVPIVVTYHPAYLLRNLADKAKSWADLCLAREIYERSG
jgi:uracil-DNA glycosylase family 4